MAGAIELTTRSGIVTQPSTHSLGSLGAAPEPARPGSHRMTCGRRHPGGASPSRPSTTDPRLDGGPDDGASRRERPQVRAIVADAELVALRWDDERVGALHW